MKMIITFDYKLGIGTAVITTDVVESRERIT